MLSFKLYRNHLKDTYTIGDLFYTQDELDYTFFSNSLEDKVRDYNKDGDLDEVGETKVMHETAIPYGKYKLLLTWSPKYQRIMPYLQNVKGFEGIRIHSGNDADDSSGCILLGFNKEKGKVLNSKDTIEKFEKLLADNPQEFYWFEIV